MLTVQREDTEALSIEATIPAARKGQSWDLNPGPCDRGRLDSLIPLLGALSTRSGSILGAPQLCPLCTLHALSEFRVVPSLCSAPGNPPSSPEEAHASQTSSLVLPCHLVPAPALA